jgi:hypothetical protein
MFKNAIYRELGTYVELELNGRLEEFYVTYEVEKGDECGSAECELISAVHHPSKQQCDWVTEVYEDEIIYQIEHQHDE